MAASSNNPNTPRAPTLDGPTVNPTITPVAGGKPAPVNGMDGPVLDRNMQPPRPTSGPGSRGPTRYSTNFQGGGGGGGGLFDWERKLEEHNTDAITREVQEEELARYQLGLMTDGNSRYVESARQRGREESAARGMLTSSYGAGAAERAAIDAAAPIAAQDAGWYGQTAKDNMDAGNQQNLADQQNAASLTGQDMGNRSAERIAASNRSAQLSIAAMQANTQLETAEMELGFRREEMAWRGDQAGLDRTFTLEQQERDQAFRGGEADRQRMHERIGFYYQQAFGREGQVSQILSAIYSNPNLTPAQQANAARNAIAQQRSLYDSTGAALGQGVPTIFWQPYEYSGAAAAPSDYVYQPGAGDFPGISNPRAGGGMGGGGGNGGYGQYY